ncbi:hypothetical protein SAMN02745163_02476 [Clostridium cavendishii DSM 21758]|uniref:RsgI N-terminal anti-sigma domain-containing protein n=1 Tax=Clostridium cavendishii DSM 21758 TaxID=1121302 RepID=A0A1M6LSL9_9CLOT|nr:hypothetical protein [Clostridium cavendishii]SHJ74163.1 hypothetical protein SAMN02745163_02476 [Clostridium cavendishii DSM 21758]
MSEIIFERDKYIFKSSNKLKVVKNNDINGRDIFFFAKELKLYKVSLESLVNSSITDDMKNLSLNIAYYLSKDNSLFEKFSKKRELPFNELSKSIKISKLQLERMNDYIIAYSLIIGNENFKSINEYVNIGIKEDNNESDINIEKDIYSGIVLKNNKKNNIILTANGDFISINRTEKDSLGREIVGKEKKGLKRYKGKIILLLVILSMLIGVMIYRYTKSESIIRIQATSGIKIEVNCFNKIINVTSETEKGKMLANSINVKGEDTSEGIIEAIKYITENKMFLDSGTGMNIIIIGSPIKDSDLQKAKEYIRYEELKININNSGELVDIKPLTKEEKEAKKQKEKIIKAKEKEKKEQEDKIITIEKQKK